MSDLIYLNIVVRVFAIDDDGLTLGEIRTYSDNWLECYVDGVFIRAYHFLSRGLE